MLSSSFYAIFKKKKSSSTEHKYLKQCYNRRLVAVFVDLQNEMAVAPGLNSVIASQFGFLRVPTDLPKLLLIRVEVLTFILFYFQASGL